MHETRNHWFRRKVTLSAAMATEVRIVLSACCIMCAVLDAVSSGLIRRRTIGWKIMP